MTERERRGYRNPVIPGFHPDPSVCRAGDAYYLAASSFTYFPGVPIFRSLDLVDWVQIGNVLERPAQLDLSGSRASPSFGVFAPTLRHHAGRFWMITTNFGEKGAWNFFVTARDPAGPWSDPVRVKIAGIDPDLAWDGAGRCWVHFSRGVDVARCRIDDTTGEVLDGPARTWSGTGLQYPEAPHVFERAGTWYLLIAEGGTERGHAVSIARGPSPEGPWEGCPANPIKSHRSTNRPIQSTGHADLVEATDGSWWMVLLGIRPRGVTPGFHVLGRETFLAPVEWVDGWPTVGEIALEMECRPPGPEASDDASARDDFDAASLHPRWIAVRRPPAELASLAERPGWLTLHGGEAALDAPEPVFVGRRQQHLRCRTRVKLEVGREGEAGLAVRMDGASYYAVAAAGERVVARARIGPLAAVVGEAPRPAGAIVLGIEMVAHPHGPDGVRLFVEDVSGSAHVLAEL
ncbi:MAG TPA: glycoside hydrolase family 43 protein, partial [Myxococcota bacterium]|nr:glycoside hydrolase family 43 protein [Myxococcota bacterium]